MRSPKLHIRRVCSRAHEFPSTRRRSSFPNRRKGIAMPSDRPFVFCHMLTSLDGKISGDYMSTPEGGIAGEVFDRIAFGTHPYSRRSHRNKEKQATPRSLPPDPHSLAKSGSEQPASVVVTPIPGRQMSVSVQRSARTSEDFQILSPRSISVPCARCEGTCEEERATKVPDRCVRSSKVSEKCRMTVRKHSREIPAKPNSL